MAAVRRTRALSVWLPVVVWAAVIFTFSSLPGSANELPWWEVVLRKVAHVVEYTALGALLLRAIGHEATAFAGGVAYAASDEIHQHFVPRRTPSPRDVAIDSAGLLLGFLVWRWWSRRSPSTLRRDA